MKKFRSFPAFLVLAAFSVSSVPAHAWTRLGHRTVGAIGEIFLNKIDPEAARRATAILNRGRTPDPSKTKVTFAGVANAPDDFKNDTGVHFERENAASTSATQVPGLGTRFPGSLHFLNIPDGFTFVDENFKPFDPRLPVVRRRPDASGDAMVALAKAEIFLSPLPASVLAQDLPSGNVVISAAAPPTNVPEEERQRLHLIELKKQWIQEKSAMSPTALAEAREQWLKLYIHIVGDMQQPLHVSRPAADYYVDTGLPVPSPNANPAVPMDMGGNLIPVIFKGLMTDLHLIWDEELPPQAQGDIPFEVLRLLGKTTRAAFPDEVVKGATDVSNFQNYGKPRTKATYASLVQAHYHEWVRESLLYREKVYDENLFHRVGGPRGLFPVHPMLEAQGARGDTRVVDETYIRAHAEYAEGRILLGGMRLAYRLSRVLNPTSSSP